MDGVELVMKIEEKYNLDIPDEDAEKMLNVGDVIKYVTEKVGSNTQKY